jgi:hypothetical protein
MIVGLRRRRDRGGQGARWKARALPEGEDRHAEGLTGE